MAEDTFVYRLTLYVAGGGIRATHAARNIRRYFEEVVQTPYELDIVDVLQEPEKAEAAHILATPTLVIEEPSPARRVVGDFSDQTQLRGVLGASPAPTEGCAREE
ncbi:MAG: circadian clock KaiB family protein [Candidatus Brocadiia bacterium]